MKYKHEAIFCIVNAGNADAVMDTAKTFGASGGTVIHARGTANTEAEKLYEITVHPEKEIVMILVSSELKDDILTALYRSVGLNSVGQGIAFSMPVDAVVGLAEEKPSVHSLQEKKVPAKATPKEKPKSTEAQ